MKEASILFRRNCYPQCARIGDEALTSTPLFKDASKVQRSCHGLRRYASIFTCTLFFSLRHCTFLHVSISVWLRTQATFANDVVVLGELFALRATAVLVRQWASVENLLIYRECKRPLERTMLRMKSGKIPRVRQPVIY